MLCPGDGRADRALWCAVIATALNDALKVTAAGGEPVVAQV